jgi:hypothetical protein
MPQQQQFDDPEKQKLWDHYVASQQEKDPSWKKFGRGVVDAISGVFEGLAGSEPRAERSDAGDWSNLATQGVSSLAGLPFASFAKKGINRLFHGTQKNFERFDPSVYDKYDVLGWMTHAAEDAEYGNKYAMGRSKGIISIDDSEDYTIDSSYLNPWGLPHRDVTPQILPIKPEANNVLDLVEPNIDDLSQALASMDSWNRRLEIKRFKNAKKGDFGPNPIKSSHAKTINELSTDATPATRTLSENLRLTAEEFDRSPFDAIRYLDVGNKSWAFPAKTPLRTVYGKHGEVLGPELHPEVGTSPLKMYKVPHDYKADPNDLPVVRGKYVAFKVKGDDAAPKYFNTEKEAADYSNEHSYYDYLSEDEFKKQGYHLPSKKKEVKINQPTIKLKDHWTEDYIDDMYSNNNINVDEWGELHKQLKNKSINKHSIYGEDDPNNLPNWIVTNTKGEYLGGSNNELSLDLEPGEHIVSKTHWNSMQSKSEQYLKTPIGDVSLDKFLKMNPQHTKESAIEYAKKAGYELFTK